MSVDTKDIQNIWQWLGLVYVLSFCLFVIFAFLTIKIF